MSSEEKKGKKKGRKNKHVHKRQTIFVEEELLKKFYEKFPRVNFSYFVEICMKQALKAVGEEYDLLEDEILMGKLRGHINKIKQILEHEKFKMLIDAVKALEIATREGDIAKKVK